MAENLLTASPTPKMASLQLSADGIISTIDKLEEFTKNNLDTAYDFLKVVVHGWQDITKRNFDGVVQDLVDGKKDLSTIWSNIRSVFGL